MEFCLGIYFHVNVLGLILNPKHLKETADLLVRGALAMVLQLNTITISTPVYLWPVPDLHLLCI